MARARPARATSRQFPADLSRAASLRLEPEVAAVPRRYARPGRRRQVRIRASPVEPHGRADQRHSRDRPHHPPVLGLDVAQRLADAVDRAGRDARRLEQLEPLPQPVSARIAAPTSPTISSRLATRAAFDAKRVIADPFGMTANLGQPRELPLVADRDDDRLIGGVERLIGHDIGVGIALPRRVLARNQRIRSLVGEHRQLRVEQRHVDMRALARFLAPIERGEDRDAVYMPVNRSATATPARIGPPPGSPSGRPVMLIIPPMPWMMIVVAGAVGVRPVLAEAGDRGVDQARVRGAKRLRVEPELLEAADLEILDHDVGVARPACGPAPRLPPCRNRSRRISCRGCSSGNRPRRVGHLRHARAAPSGAYRRRCPAARS